MALGIRLQHIAMAAASTTLQKKLESADHRPILKSFSNREGLG